MSEDKKTIIQKWQSLSPRNRMIAVFGGLAAVIMIGSMAFAPKVPEIQHKKPLAQVTLGMPGAGRDLSIEKLSASMAAIQKDQGSLHQELENTQKEEKEAQKTAALAPPPVDPEVADLKRQLQEMKSQLNKQSSLDDALPPPGQVPVPPPPAQAKASQTMDDQVVVDAPKPKPVGFKVVDDGFQPAADHQDENADPPVYLPAGSNFEAVFLNGMDAPTSGFAQKNPVPSVMRVKTDAILPNRYRYDVSECFVLVSGFGQLASERVILQTTTLSCVKTNGKVIESKIEGYVVGEDGRVGVRGRVISKQGSLLAKSFVSGFFSGIAGSMAPYAVPQLSVAPTSTAQYQTPNLGMVATAGTAQGVAQSAKMLSQFYLDMASQMFPVVELDASRRATIVLVKGTELNFKEVSK